LQAGTHPWSAAAVAGGLDDAGDVDAGPDADDDAALPDPPHAPASAKIVMTTPATRDLSAQPASRRPANAANIARHTWPP
jgi:hypothetical protein